MYVKWIDKIARWGSVSTRKILFSIIAFNTSGKSRRMIVNTRIEEKVDEIDHDWSLQSLERVEIYTGIDTCKLSLVNDDHDLILDNSTRIEGMPRIN